LPFKCNLQRYTAGAHIAAAESRRSKEELAERIACISASRLFASSLRGALNRWAGAARWGCV
jgi:hypothetical protein